MVTLRIIVIGSLLSALTIFQAIVSPLEGACERRGARQFHLADFLCLFVLIQVPIAIIHAVGRANSAKLTSCLVADGVALIAFGGAWVFGVLLLSRAGIENVRHRALVLTAVLPLALFGSMIAATLSAWLCFAPILPESRNSDDWSWRTWALVFAANAVLIGALWWAGRFTRLIVKSSQPPS